MSLQTWKAEFYPVDVTYGEMSKWSNELLLAHALKKWVGLRKENMEKHNVRFYIDSCGDAEYCKIVGNYERDAFMVNSASCTLCVVYADNVSYDTKCKQCPLVFALGKKCDLDYTAPWHVWRKSGNPEPMIAALKLALVKVAELSTVVSGVDKEVVDNIKRDVDAKLADMKNYITLGQHFEKELKDLSNRLKEIL